MAAQNKPNFALFTCKVRKFSISSLVTFSILTNQINGGFACVVYVFARVLCSRYDARWISKTKSKNTRKRRNGGIINPLFDGLTYNTSGQFAQLAKHPRVLYVKPSNKVYIFKISSPVNEEGKHDVIKTTEAT